MDPHEVVVHLDVERAVCKGDGREDIQCQCIVAVLRMRRRISEGHTSINKFGWIDGSTFSVLGGVNPGLVVFVDEFDCVFDEKPEMVQL